MGTINSIIKTTSMRKLPLFYPAFVCAYLASVVMAIISCQYYYIPLIVLLLLCAIAPFLVTTGFFLHIIARGKNSGVTLTFDDGPDMTLAPHLLKLLDQNKIKATFFVRGDEAEKNPEILQMIHKQGHTIGNHSYRHSPFLMLQTSKKLYSDIQKTNEILKKAGIPVAYFRPPAGITNPRLGPVLQKLNLLCVNFSCRAFDRGNRNINNLSKKILRKVKPGDIILLHDNMSKTMDPDYYLHEIQNIITGLQAKGLEIYSLETFINNPVGEQK